MKIEESVKDRIVRNVILSLFIYALPLVLMFSTFYFTGQRPWEKKQPNNKINKSINNSKPINNGNNN